MPQRRFAPALLVLLAGLLLCSTAGAAGTGTGWGYNPYGEVTAPPTESLNVPTPVAGVAGATQIVPGAYHTLALLSDGTVVNWGYNVEGQLGLGSSTGPEKCKTSDCSTKPVPVPGLSGVVAVTASDYNSFALLSNGTVMAWGDNTYGQLGVGTGTGPESCNGYDCSAKPIPIPGLANVIAISGGDDTIAALLADGTVMTWGVGEYGQLGNGGAIENSCGCINHPIPVPGVTNAVAVAMGEYGGSAVLADGSAVSWGYNISGELGNGTISAGGCECLGPVAVAGLTGVREISVGQYHRMARLADGTVRGWGSNGEGELGTGSTSSGGCSCVLAPVAPIGLGPVRAVAADSTFTLALLADGTVRSWGSSLYGEMGGGSAKENRVTPDPVAGLNGVSDLDAGEYNGFAVIGPSQALTVELAGAGAGRVGADGIVCPASNCSESFSQGATKILRASSTAGGFAGFSGACTGLGPCQVRMDGDRTVTATFGAPKGTAITAATVNSKKKKASFSFTAPGAVTGYECRLVRPAAKPRKKRKKGKGAKKRVTLAKKGAKPKPKPKPKPVAFSACAGPASYAKLKPGRYTFEVRALNIIGADAVPAVRKFTIKKLKPKPRPKKRK